MAFNPAKELPFAAVGQMFTYVFRSNVEEKANGIELA